MGKLKKHIFVADDDPSILDVLRLVLEDEGYIVTESLNGHSVYSLHDNLPDLFLLDILMSGTDGRDLCNYLKRNKKTRNIPVIMLAAHRDMKQISKAAGGDDFIERPFEIVDLLDKIKSWT